jgi:hypothetical protein
MAPRLVKVVQAVAEAVLTMVPPLFFSSFSGVSISATAEPESAQEIAETRNALQRGQG